MGIGKQAKTLTSKQVDLVLKHLESTRYPLRNKVIFMFSCKAGLRAKEIANITWSMICNSDGELGSSINLTNKASKGKDSGRVIPLHKDLRTLLSELLEKRRQQDNFTVSDHVIRTERDSKTSPQVIVNFFSGLYKGIGFEGASSHSGRRTFITNAAKKISLAGGTLNDIKLLAGHSSLATTQRYIAYDTEAQKKIIELI